MTGNTHRAEICIDKLYSPDGPTGRLGLVEFRSFEMPPHARMSLAQQLLMRALIAMFWERPYRQQAGPLGHGPARPLHAAALPLGGLQLHYRRPQGPRAARRTRVVPPALRVPLPQLGSISAFDVELELRQALEPWHVLGEEGAAGGTARYVDSSLERVQVKVRGLTGDRFIVTCNGRTLPLERPRAPSGEAVAGVRYRAWRPPSALHPTIPPHVPLVFDIVDTWTGRSVAAAAITSRTPAAADFETFPVNAYEAEGRRLARFEDNGHTAGTHEAGPRRPINPDYPLTLDLRRRV